MRRSLHFSAALLLAALAACSVTPREYGSTGGTGGGSGGQGGTGGSGAAAQTGGGGTGGMPITATCAPSGLVFDVFDPAMLAGRTFDDKILVIADPSQNDRAHVVLIDNSSEDVLIRTLTDGASPIGGKVISHAPVGFDYFEPKRGWAEPTQLVIYGRSSQGVSRASFPMNEGNGVGVDGSYVALVTPPQCFQGYTAGVAFDRNMAGETFYLVGCGSPAAGGAGLFAGSEGSSGYTQIADVPESDPLLDPHQYVIVNGVHLASFQDGPGSTMVSFGGKPEDLGVPKPFSVSNAPSELSFLLGLVPLPSHDGVAVLGGKLPMSNTNVQILSGSVLTKDYGTFYQVPPPWLKVIQTAPSINDLAPLFNPTFDPKGIYAAGPTVSGQQVLFTWLERDGKPLVSGQEIYKTGDTQVISAGAAPLGLINTVVVWVESDANGDSYQVRGQHIVCSK